MAFRRVGWAKQHRINRYSCTVSMAITHGFLLCVDVVCGGMVCASNSACFDAPPLTEVSKSDAFSDECLLKRRARKSAAVWGRGG